MQKSNNPTNENIGRVETGTPILPTTPHPHTAESSFDIITDALRSQGRRVVVQHDGDALAQCPAHDDTNPSLHLTHREDRTLLKCFAGCDTDSILDSLGLDAGALFDEPLEKSERPWFPRARALSSLVEPEERIEYVPAEGDFPRPYPPLPDSWRDVSRPGGRFDWAAESPWFARICSLLHIGVRANRRRVHCPVCGGVARIMYSPLEFATLLACDGGCEPASLLDSLGLVEQARLHRERKASGQAVVYDDPRGVVYRYEDGLEVHRSVVKRFSQSGNHGHGVKHCLYRKSLIREWKDSRPIVFVEGEKDANTWIARGYAATTAPSGAGNLSEVLDPEQTEWTLGNAVVWAVKDNDTAGDRWLDQVLAFISPMAKKVIPCAM